FERHVDADGRVDLHFDVLANHFLEALELGRPGVAPVRQARERVVPRFVADRRAADVGLHFRRRHGYAGNLTSTGIGDVTEERARDRLRGGRGGNGTEADGYGRR